MTETIGIIGAGDLGQKMLVQIAASSKNAVYFEKYKRKVLTLGIGIDPNLKFTDTSKKISCRSSISEVLNTASIVHFCAPLNSVLQIEHLPKDTMLVFHNSVMADSLSTVSNLQNLDSIQGVLAIGHCLMNDSLSVIVCNDLPGKDLLVDHILEIGLKPIELSAFEHDRIMAVSQAPMAILHALLDKELEILEGKGLLTPSGKDLNIALHERAAKWTSQTFKAILANPQIKNYLLERMNNLIDGIQNGSLRPE